MTRPTSVAAHFDDEGEITPRRFTWAGTTLTVERVGRRWREQETRCFLVMVAGGTVYELRLDEHTLRWRVDRVGGKPFVA